MAPPAQSALPLSGKRIVITRALSQAPELARKLEECGAEVIEIPTIEIQPPEDSRALDAAIQNVGGYHWLIFTSVNGVERFFARARTLGRTVPQSPAARYAAIGPETAKRLGEAGIESCIVPKVFQAEGLLEALRSEDMRGKRVLIPRAERARDVLPETLRAWGAVVDVVGSYRTVLPDVRYEGNPLRAERADAITFTSSSTVTNFARLFGAVNLADLLSGVTVACIGEITQKTVEELGARADIVARESTIDGLVEALSKYFNRRDGVRGAAGEGA